jgi:transcriptional regulator with XRE-family HTH domain
MKNNFRLFREKANLTQKEVAAALGIPQQTYSTYETGLFECDYKNLLKLSFIFKTSINELLGDSKENLIVITKDQFVKMKSASETLSEILSKIPDNSINIHDNATVNIDNHGTAFIKK